MVAVAASTDHGDILVDEEGFTIYAFDGDAVGISTCTSECAINWPPVIVDQVPEADPNVSATLGTIVRDEGRLQLTINGYPAYYW
jgi:predicted lipoprotein with Yx(FWY)xxD motif